MTRTYYLCSEHDRTKHYRTKQNRRPDDSRNLTPKLSSSNVLTKVQLHVRTRYLL